MGRKKTPGLIMRSGIWHVDKHVFGRRVCQSTGTARLEEANAGDLPIHLRVWRNVSHGTADPVVSAAYYAEWLAFVMDQIGMTAALIRA